MAGNIQELVFTLNNIMTSAGENAGVALYSHKKDAVILVFGKGNDWAVEIKEHDGIVVSERTAPVSMPPLSWTDTNGNVVKVMPTDDEHDQYAQAHEDGGEGAAAAYQQERMAEAQKGTKGKKARKE